MPKKKKVAEVPENIKEIQSIIDDQASRDLGVKVENGKIKEEEIKTDPVTTELDKTEEQKIEPEKEKAVC